VRKRLPASYSIIYALGQLSDSRLDLAIESGFLHPRLKRSELGKWLEDEIPGRSIATGNPAQKTFAETFVDPLRHAGRTELAEPSPAQPRSEDDQNLGGEHAQGIEGEKPEAEDPDDSESPSSRRLPSVPGEYYAAIRLPDHMEPSQLDLLEELLERIVSECHAEIVRPIDSYRKRLERWQSNLMNRARQEARSIIKGVKKRTVARGETWGLAPDETSIPPDADLEDIERILDSVSARDQMPAVHEAMNANGPATPKNLRLPQIDPQAEFEQIEGQLRDDFLAGREREATVLRRLREVIAIGAQTQPAPEKDTAVQSETELR
jgi:hypothetical protein